MKIISWNINSIRKRLQLLEQLLLVEKPDIVYLQETRVSNALWPTIESQYHIYREGEKSGRNGVAILSKWPLILEEGDSRYLKASLTHNGTSYHLLNLYVPNGFSVSASREHKIFFLNNIQNKYQHLKNLIIGGDFNIIPSIAHSTIGDLFSPEEHLAFRSLSEKLQVIAPRGLTWWDYRTYKFNPRLGMTLDFYLLSHCLEARGLDVISTYRNVENCSDHAPIILNLS